MSDDTIAVSFAITEAERMPPAMAPLLAIVSAEVNLGGVVLLLGGIRVMARRSGQVVARTAFWRHPITGVWAPGVLLPQPLEKALIAAALEAVAE
jgi:hypothetical protein